MCGCRKNKGVSQPLGVQSPTAGTGLQGLSANDPVIINLPEDDAGE